MKTMKISRTRMLLYLVVCLSLAFSSSNALAQNILWEGGVSNDWSNTENWDLKSLPGSSDNVYLHKNDTLDWQVFYQGSHDLGQLSIDNTGGGQFTLDYSNPQYVELSTIDTIVGDAGQGQFDQNTGRHTTSTLILGTGTNSIGRYNLAAGTLKAAYGGYIGYNGAGYFNQTGGQATFGSLAGGGLQLGGLYNPLSFGEYSLSGQALLTTYNVDIGIVGNGAFIQEDSSTHMLHGMMRVGHYGFGSPSLGTYTLNNGSLIMDSIAFIGYTGEGEFHQSGGTFSSSGIVLGEFNVGHGLYQMSGGTLNVNNSDIVVGNYGSGGFFQSGGNVNLTGDSNWGGIPHASSLMLGNGAEGYGAYYLSGGYLNSRLVYVGQNQYLPDASSIPDPTFGSGYFQQSGGTHTVEHGLQVNAFSSYILQNGNLNAGMVQVNGGGTFVQDGGVNTVDRLEIHENSSVYQMNGGVLDVKDEIAIGGGINGDMIINNGVVSTELLTVADGRLTMLGGTLSARTIDLTQTWPGPGFTMTGGTLETFAINGNYLNSGGTISPGASPGIMTVSGDLTQGTSATLFMELAGLNQGTEYDLLSVSGTLNLAGILDVEFVDGFTAKVGDSFDILDWGVLNGTFDTIFLPYYNDVWDVSTLYVDGIITLASEPVPLPGAVYLFGSGLLGLLGLRRKKKCINCKIFS